MCIINIGSVGLFCRPSPTLGLLLVLKLVAFLKGEFCTSLAMCCRSSGSLSPCFGKQVGVMVKIVRGYKGRFHLSLSLAIHDPPNLPFTFQEVECQQPFKTN